MSECKLKLWDGKNIQAYVKIRETCECKDCLELRKKRKQRLIETANEIIENQTVHIVFPGEDE